ncbi:MAG: hypothetical protein E4H28_00705 [Gemmatimonadales bacterium]|nr:MAG: hypothetical protein E4H28_00705 [Gemmatimonadales bacterium]
MKFLCLECDEQMIFEDRQLPGDGTLAAAFRCPSCERIVAMLTNPMETQLVSSLGIKIGGSEVPAQPLELVRSEVVGGREDAFVDSEVTNAPESVGRVPGAVVWSLAAVERLDGVPRFVRGMVKRIYADYAKENGISEITPAIMDQARTDLGLEGM